MVVDVEDGQCAEQPMEFGFEHLMNWPVGVAEDMPPLDQYAPFLHWHTVVVEPNMRDLVEEQRFVFDVEFVTRYHRHVTRLVVAVVLGYSRSKVD